MSTGTSPPPFPATSTASGENINFEPPDVDRVVFPPTCPLPQVRELRKVCEAYTARVPGTGKGLGRCYLLRGETGTGKTHTLVDAMLRLARRNRAGARRPLLAAYAKGQSPDLAVAFRDLLARVTKARLRNLGLSAMAALAVPDKPPAQPARSPDEPPQWGEGPAGVEPPIPGRPERFVDDLQRRLQLQRGGIWDEQAAVLRPHKPLGAEFPEAFSYLLGPELGRDPSLADAARDWLVGEPLDPKVLAQLGVSRSLAGAADLAQAVHFLATLCGLAGCPYVLTLDQLEKVVAPAPPAVPDPEAIGLLHSLIETIPGENGLLLLAGTDEAWAALPRDIQNRIGLNNVIPCERLSPALAREVVAVYLHPDETADRAEPVTAADIRPFDPAAVDALLAYGGGAIRRFLQLASRAHEQRAGAASPITPDDVRRASQGAFPDNDPVTLRKIIRDVLQSRQLPFDTDYAVGGTTVDFAIRLPGGGPRLLVAVSQSVFLTDEVDEAKRLFSLARAAGQMPTRPPLVVVLAGYASPDVTRELAGFAYAVLLYDPESVAPPAAAGPEAPESFATRLGAVLGTFSVHASAPLPEAAADPAVAKALDERITRIQEVLENLARTREPVQAAIEDRLEEEARRQAEARRATRRKEAAAAWFRERARVEEQIGQARAGRARDELAELNRMRAVGETARRRAADARLVLFGLPVLAILLWCGWLLKEERDRQAEAAARFVKWATDVQSQRQQLRSIAPQLADGYRADIRNEKAVRQKVWVIEREEKGPVTPEAAAKLNERKRELDMEAGYPYEALQLYFKLADLDADRPRSGTQDGEWNRTGLLVVPVVLGILALVRLLGGSLRARHMIGTPAGRELANAVESLRELDFIANRYLDEVFPGGPPGQPLPAGAAPSGPPGGPPSPDRMPVDPDRPSVGHLLVFRYQQILNRLLLGRPLHTRPGDLLTDPNPHFRYAATLLPTDDRLLFRFRKQLFRERAAVVREALARALGRQSGFSLLDPPFAEVPEVVYWTEAGVQRAWRMGAKSSELSHPPPLGQRSELVFQFLTDTAALRNRDSALRMLQILGVTRGEDEWWDTDLAEALVNGFERMPDLSFLPRVSDVALRDAIRLVSPLDPGGVGTFDRLTVTDQIEQVYLFLLQARFYNNWGELLVLPS